MSTERKRNSFGQCHHNEFHSGIKCSNLKVNEGRYVLDYTREFYLFDTIPMGAVRMTRSDKWKTNPFHPDPLKRQRKEVAKYWEFKNSLILQATDMKFVLGKHLDAVYLIPMPATWSEKKKAKMNGMPHEPRPDTDNITKAIKDTLRKEDSDIWWEKAEKRWAYKGSIIIFK